MTPKKLNESSRQKLAMLFPNIVTMAAILLGTSAFRHALSGKFELAVLLLIAAMILDGLDGKLARSLNAESQIGRELDSLADFFNFGIVPAFVCHLALFQHHDKSNFSWIAIMSVIGCCAFRLARFNAVDKQGDNSKQIFQGVPAPMLGLLILLPVLGHIIGLQFVHQHPIIVSLYLVFCACLAASNIPTISLKAIALTKSNTYLVLILFVISAATFMTFPWHSLIVIGLAYLTFIPIYSIRNKAVADE